MSETYQTLASFAQTGGLLLFVAAFIGVLAYVFWPSNKKAFDEASKIPLEKD